MQWLELVLGWLSKVFASEADGDNAAAEVSMVLSAPSGLSTQAGQPASSILKQWRCYMHQFFCRIYVNMRIEELFSIIRGKKDNIDVSLVLDIHKAKSQLITQMLFFHIFLYC